MLDGKNQKENKHDTFHSATALVLIFSYLPEILQFDSVLNPISNISIAFSK